MAKPRSAKGRAVETMSRLSELYPGSAPELCELDFETPFQLLVATVLSAQTTDERVNSVTPSLFARYPSAADLAFAVPEEVEEIIRSTGFFRAKTRSIMGLARELEDRFDGEVPQAMEELVTLPGVGRKTANVIRSVAFGLPGLAVDTHVTRLTRLLGLTESQDPVKIESEVCALLPPRDWGSFGLKLILHGRRVCVARRPRCADCVLNDFCPSAGIGTPRAAKVAAAAKVAKAANPAKPTNATKPSNATKSSNGAKPAKRPKASRPV
ncbi:MAG TPA: endonuclease III [Acidimicrobiales bacterium]|nr:endonuclease III [Acidimicrobiales bacterium]